MNRRVHRASHAPLHAGENRQELAQSKSTDDEQIDIALRRLPTGRDGAIDERRVDPLVEVEQGASQHIREAGSLVEYRSQFLEHGGAGVGLEVHLSPVWRSEDQAGLDQLRQFALKRADASAGFTRDFAQVELLVGAAKEQRQNVASGATEQQLGNPVRLEGGSPGQGCTHYGYLCNHNGYELRHSVKGAARTDPYRASLAYHHPLPTHEHGGSTRFSQSIAGSPIGAPGGALGACITGAAGGAGRSRNF